MNKETKELEGIKWNLLFYFPLGEKKLHAQIYDKITEDVIVEEIIKTQEDYDFATPMELSYVYIGINMKDARLSDIKVREAIAHCVDVKQVISSLLYNLGDPMNGPIQPAKKYYDKTGIY